MSAPLFHYLLIHWLIAIIPISLGIFVIAKDRNNPLYQAFLRYNFVISWWGLFNLMMEYSHNDMQALFWDRVSLLGIVFIPAAFLHFTWMYSGKSKFYKLGIAFCYYLSSIFLILAFTPWMAKSVSPKYIIPYFTDPGAAYHLFVAYFFGTMTFGNYLVLKAYLTADTEKRKTGSRIFLIATTLSTVGGGGNFMVPYEIYIPFLYPYGGYAFILYGLLITYTILRYKFLNIEVIIKKTLVFAGLFGTVIATVAAIITLTQGLIGQYLRIPMAVSTAFSVAAAIFLYEPTKRFLIHVTDKFLFQKKEDIRKVLGQLSEEAVRIFDITELSSKILNTLRDSLRLEAGTILIKDGGGKKYIVMNQFGTKTATEVFTANDLFIQFLAESGKILNFEIPEQVQNLPLEVQQSVAPFKAAVAIPLFLQDDLTGVLFLGRKISDQEFSPEELETLPTMANQIAIGLNFARKLAEEKHLYAQMGQQAKMASLGTLSAGVAHEIGNTLNNIDGMAQSFQMWQKLGAWPKFSPAEKDKNVTEIVEGVKINVDRAKAIMTRLSALSKNPETLAPEPVDFNKAVDDGVWFTEKELQWDNIRLKKEYAADLPKALANTGVIAQTMMNLINNAKDAIKMKSGGVLPVDEISVNTFLSGDKVGVRVLDTGVGIPAENLERIFDPFFTTKDVSQNPAKDAIKGTGLGLYLVKRLVQHCGGEIHVESEIGKGTAFTVEFPVCQKGGG